MAPAPCRLLVGETGGLASVRRVPLPCAGSSDVTHSRFTNNVMIAPKDGRAPQGTFQKTETEIGGINHEHGRDATAFWNFPEKLRVASLKLSRPNQ